MIEIHEAPAVYEKVIHHNIEKSETIYVMVNDFRNNEYLHIRKYYEDFDEEWTPTMGGLAIPINYDDARAE